MIAMQKATHKTLLTTEILQLTWNSKALTQRKKVQIKSWKWQLKSTFIFSIYPPKIAFLKFHLAQNWLMGEQFPVVHSLQYF